MPQLYAITTVYNPAGYELRFRLYREFAKRLDKCGVALYTVELATGDQDFAVTDAEDPRHIRLRSPHTLWYKENLINIAIARLPGDWEYVAWLDADIQFLPPGLGYANDCRTSAARLRPAVLAYGRPRTEL